VTADRTTGDDHGPGDAPAAPEPFPREGAATIGAGLDHQREPGAVIQGMTAVDDHDEAGYGHGV
jgi:hypothetical protein